MFVLISLVCQSILASIVNDDIKREFDVKGDALFIRYTIDFHLEDQKPDGAFYDFFLEYPVVKLSMVSFTLNGLPLQATFVEDENMYRIQLPKSIDGDETVTLHANVIYVHVLEPRPRQHTQDETAFVELLGSLVFPSPYPTTADSIIVHIHTDTILSHSEELQINQDKGRCKSSNGDVEPNTKIPFSIRYANPSPLLTISRYTRDVTISHGTDCHVEETYGVKNAGSKLIGEFNKFKTMVTPPSDSNIVRKYNLNIPKSSTNLYYRDEIGNISTSTVHAFNWESNQTGYLEMELEPRFHLWGGWKSTFYTGWNVGLSEFKRARELVTTSIQTKPSFFYSDEQSEVDSFQNDKSFKTAALPAREHTLVVPLAASMTYTPANVGILRLALPEGAKNVRCWANGFGSYNAVPIELVYDEEENNEEWDKKVEAVRIGSEPSYWEELAGDLTFYKEKDRGTRSLNGMPLDTEGSYKGRKTFSAMDYLGRRTFLFRRHNAINAPMFETIVIEYDLPTVFLAHKPLILIGLLLLFYIGYVILSKFAGWFKSGPLSQALPENIVEPRKVKKN
ncbi:putative Dolichyl-diphosphooligosaccharide--protein glycosyltransferase subunit 1 [Blattamonas nauphoetae]|uniref:Dolichyl-diphosphooligosaccharide--protein glycosyltransferase subunit 1 n=1 Tax=Blattamonas nauphoetae TaxID=2049346 RepID=A0ABQ9YL15_9EUKA|nr:putative Dolichyl-diphosphooligosaccharide--protein glycosyltransferase subunit 1 [Blattamonas nauphoetae]